MRVPIQKGDEGKEPAAAGSRSENLRTQSPTGHHTDRSRHDSTAESPLEHAGDSSLADASLADTEVDDEGTLILTPTSSTRSRTPVMGADNIDAHSGASEEAVDNFSAADSRSDRFSAGSYDNATPRSNFFYFANPSASRPSNPSNSNTSSHSYNILSSNSESPYISSISSSSSGSGFSFSSSSSSISSSNNSFTNATLSGYNFIDGTTITNCDLKYCKGQKLRLTNCDLKSCKVSNSTATNCDISLSNLINNKLTNCDLSNHCHVLGGSRTNCTFRESDVNGAKGLMEAEGLMGKGSLERKRSDERL